MKLYGTPLSHFTRKVRILADLYNASYDFIDIGNVADGTIETFAGNPLMKVPVLKDGENWIIESDYIARYLSEKFDPADRFSVKTVNVQDLNIRAVLNGIMSEEVKVILAKRTGVPIEQYRFFDDALETIASGLSWLEQNAAAFDIETPSYKNFHFVCAWEHLVYYDLLPMPYPRLAKLFEKLGGHETIKKTSPFVLKPKG